ncbi:MAG: FG-GAP-like repeat-containing protein [Bacteroidota bacterium]
MRIIVFLALSLFVCQLVVGQVPIINNVTPLTTYPQNTVLITGSGFNNNVSQLQVWFDQVKGTITASSEFSIEVAVPPQARISNIEVINLSSGFSARTLEKFVLYYSGNTFNEASFLAPTANVTTFSSGSAEESFDVCSCDLNGDDMPDLVSTKSGNTSASMMVLKNTSTPGNLAFTSQASVIVGAPTFNIVCGDLNGDGKPELIASRAVASRNQIFIFKNTSSAGTISFASPTIISLDAGDNAIKPVIRDLNLDGKPDLVVSNSATSAVNTVYVFGNTSSGGNITFAAATRILITGAATTYGIDAQDLDGDQKPEIILNQFTSNDIFIVKNTSSVGELAFSSTIQKITLTGTLNQLTTADFNEDGKLDIAVTSTFDDFLYVLLNQSSGSSISFGTPTQLITGDSPWGIDVSDIDGDQDVDIIVGNRGAETTISVFKNDGAPNPSFSKVSITSGKKSRNLRVGDFDGDGKPDIAFTTDTGNSVDILRNMNCFMPLITNPPATICAGQTISLESIANAGATFDWIKDGTSAKNGNESFLDITTPGNYSVTATSEASSCIISSTSIAVALGTGSLPPDPVLGANTPLCSGQTLNLSVPSVSGATYQWTGPNSFTSTLQNPSRPSVTNEDAGFYTLKLSDGTCTVESAIRVDVANLENFSVSSSVAANSVCQGSGLNLLVNTASGHTYQWIKDGVDMNGETSSTLIVNQEGVYQVRVTNTSLSCFVETDTTTVRVFTMPVSDFIPSTNSTCMGQEVTFNNESTFDSRATVAYAWDFGDGTNSTLEEPSKIYTTAATQNVQLTISYTGVTGCSNASTKSIEVAAAQIPVINATLNPICVGEASVLSVTGTFTTYTWTGPVTGSSATLNIDQPGTYVVNTQEASGCSATAEIIIDTKPLVELSVIADDLPVASGEDLIVFAGIAVQMVATGADSYSWAPPDGFDNPSISNPLLTPLVETTYMVTGSTTDFCDGVFSFNIKFDPAGNSFLPPNAFSPNGDATNDLWTIPAVQSFSDCTISIFNKQGSKVFEQKGYSNNWDGTYEGKELPEGTYYYVLTCPDKQPETGHVLLAR